MAKNETTEDNLKFSLMSNLNAVCIVTTWQLVLLSFIGTKHDNVPCGDNPNSI